MGAEVLLYGYGLVCASMLVFNVVYSLHLRSDDRRRYKRMQKLRRRIDGQLRGIQGESAGAPQPVQVSHLTWMRRRLSHVNYLLAFDRLLDEWTERQAVLPSYIGQLQPVFLYLSTVYLRREAARRPTTATSSPGTTCAGTWRRTRSSRSSSPIWAGTASTARSTP